MRSTVIIIIIITLTSISSKINQGYGQLLHSEETRFVEQFCSIQLQSIKSGLANLQLPSDEEKRRAVETANQVVTDEDGKIWKKGEQEFETLMKHLDNAVSFQINSKIIIPEMFIKLWY